MKVINYGESFIIRVLIDHKMHEVFSGVLKAAGYKHQSNEEEFGNDDVEFLITTNIQTAARLEKLIGVYK